MKFLYSNELRMYFYPGSLWGDIVTDVIQLLVESASRISYHLKEAFYCVCQNSVCFATIVKTIHLRLLTLIWGYRFGVNYRKAHQGIIFSIVFW
jgi:hypothetical protein